jgi:hypothetical protein
MGASNYQLALSRRYSKLTGELREVRANIARIKTEQKKLPGLEASIPRLEKLIKSLANLLEAEDPQWTAHASPPMKPFTHVIPIPFGTCSRRGLAVLKQSDRPLTAREIAIEVLRQCGNEQPPADVVLRTTNTITASLRKFRGRVVESSGTYPAQWRVMHKAHIQFDQ